MNGFYADPLQMILQAPARVGAAMMVPGAPSSLSGGACGPSRCPPLDYCTPQSAGFYGQAAASAAAAQAPQSTLGINTLDQSPNTKVGAGLARTISTSPSVPICLTQFKVSRVSAPFFQLTSIRAAKTEYLSDGQSIPADDYTADSTTPPIRLPMLMPGSQISVGLLNIDSADHHFFAEFRGFDGPGCYPCL